jgi:hypothetical protein
MFDADRLTVDHWAVSFLRGVGLLVREWTDVLLTDMRLTLTPIFVSHDMDGSGLPARHATGRAASPACYGSPLHRRRRGRPATRLQLKAFRFLQAHQDPARPPRSLYLTAVRFNHPLLSIHRRWLLLWLAIFFVFNLRYVCHCDENMK